MSKAKKLDLSLEELKVIAIELNENTIANRSRSKKDKIVTDKYIRKFNITRKDFSETIKGTGISYNRSTFLYDIDLEKINSAAIIKDSKVDSVNLKKESESNTKECKLNCNVKEDRSKKVTPSNNKITLSNTKVTPKEKNDKDTIDIIKILEEQLPEVLELVKEYKKNNFTEKNILNLENEKLSGESITRSFKTYKKVLDDFSLFCKNRKESQKDLLAIALIEFMERYN
ncbi:hypothetical protein KCK39_002909 [Clostridium perfringens]|nr:hypothetical protein [Clostridium perfringens]